MALQSNILRPLKFHVLAGALALCAAGCVQVEQTITLKEDGSGNLAVRYGMPLETIQKMEEVSRQAEQMGALAGEKINSSSPFDFSEADIRRDFTEYEELGIALKSVDIQMTNGWKFVDLDMSFQSLRGLLRTEFLSDRRLSLTTNEAGQFVFYQAPPVEEMSLKDMAGLDEEAMKEMVATMMKGFRAKLTVKVPGVIASTTADRHTDRSATWVFDLDQDPGAFARAQTQAMQIVFSGDGLNLPECRGAN